MKHLIIIGNGFDLAHGLKTDYESFIADVTNNINKYGLEELRANTFLLLLSRLSLSNSNWSDIECVYFDMLLHIDNKKSFYDKFKVSLSDHYNVSRLNENFQQVKEVLAKYLHEQEKKFEKNKNYEEFFECLEQMDDVVVLNFNYTNTVKQYLKPDSNIKLIHIHGELDGDVESKENPMIFGYAADDAESKLLLDENDSQYVRNIKKFNYLFTLNDSLLKLYINKSDKFNVLILGHSCGLSDKLILNQIFNSENVYKIFPFYYAGEKGDKGRDNYFGTMVNIDRIIDDYSKQTGEERMSIKLSPLPACMAMPQQDKVEGLRKFLVHVVNDMRTNDSSFN